MKRFLESLLPRIGIPLDTCTLIAHEGKSDLEKSIPRKLRGWNVPNTHFIVVRDQDAGDCVAVKQDLRRLCQSAGKPDALIRIACRELEAWFVADLESVERALSVSGLAKLQQRAAYRSSDTMASPSQQLAELIPGYGKVTAARAIGRTIGVDPPRSPSFRCFVDGVTALADASLP